MADNKIDEIIADYLQTEENLKDAKKAQNQRRKSLRAAVDLGFASDAQTAKINEVAPPRKPREKKA